MKRRSILFVFVFLFLHLNTTVHTEALPQMRALLISSDTFVTQPSLAPSAQTNVETMRALLSGDERAYDRITSNVNGIADERVFLESVSAAFHGAADGDISLFYISTHGLLEGPNGKNFHFLLSDGEVEFVLTLPLLHQALDPVPGRKVLVIDTCNAGMLIGKGTTWDDDFSLFRQKDFVVLTASGGSELSFNWTSGSDGTAGGSYFMLALHNALSPLGKFAADANRDGQVTVSELHAFLLVNYGPSTAQVYPEDDQFVFFRYSADHTAPDRAVLTNFVFEDTALSSDNREVTFSFTQNQRARLGYQLVYEQDGLWRFDDSQIIEDPEGSTGVSSSGRKERTLQLSEFDETPHGYVLMLIVQVEEDRTIPLHSTLLSVEADAPQTIAVWTSPRISGGQEMAIQFTHEKPCSFTVRIKDMSGLVMATPYLDRKSRPQMLEKPGTIVYWNGNDDSGERVSPGSYFAQVETTVSGQVHVSVGEFFAVD